MRCGVEPGDVGFRPRFVGVDGVWKVFWTGDGAPSSSGGSEHLLPIGLPMSSPGVSALRAAQPINDKPT